MAAKIKVADLLGSEEVAKYGPGVIAEAMQAVKEERQKQAAKAIQEIVTLALEYDDRKLRELRELRKKEKECREQRGKIAEGLEKLNNGDASVILNALPISIAQMLKQKYNLE